MRSRSLKNVNIEMPVQRGPGVVSCIAKVSYQFVFTA